MSKREADAAGGDAKKAKTDYTLNVNKALDKDQESKSFREVIKADVGALEGIGEKLTEMLNALHVKTVEDLANWKYFKAARAIVILADREEEGGRHADSKANINHLLDKEFEKKSLTELKSAPPSALQGLADWVDSALTPAHLTSIEKIATWKYALWAESLVELAKFETDGGSL
mmetsp:Transcript_19998/g.34245  ORF Transcript_19998/g.34245 Transcript_19998/m.34245 type:complete len:174 (+) Transcript_19998:56-577(+)|eukprot:CAMPEP_0168593934 /NCGR_PEP_ID=MMETSP0420-20121227/8606_1 /TAXON_ID=498008 /ORGANISM="Pessonella sp." /LENGTH=173 /DNA_ID=CAMNT_0008630173 /DNA_START=51 /DNA_END=572 /DNA_ORIENTATION=+